MEVILPFTVQGKEHFCSSAIQIGFDEFVARKFVYTMHDSDLDVYQLMGQERLSLLLYGWEVLYEHQQNQRSDSKPETVGTVIQQLAHYSLDMWFSMEWEDSSPKYKAGLIYCMKRVKSILCQMPQLSLINWDYLLRLGMSPWKLTYLNGFLEHEADGVKYDSQSIEHVEEAASEEDIDHLEKEGLFLVLLRLIKMFDAGQNEGVKKLSMRIIAAWNQVYERKKETSDIAYPLVTTDHKRCLILICHIYLMTTYETDDIRGFVIDNMMNNIRFYYQSIQETTANEDFSNDRLEYTTARYIAMTCVNLRISCTEFFEAFVFDISYDECFTTLFGAVSQAYMSYLLGNLLMEMNNMNEQDFTANFVVFKRILNLYVMERERSELFMLNEMRKQEMQLHSHNVNITVKNMTAFKSKICKGNRMSNIGNYENSEEKDSDDKVKSEVLENEESDRSIDPVFQNIPNNATVLSYVYTVLAKQAYKGWHFAKLILLLKIIGHELNVIETWRYHPGLTTDFMLNLEIKLSQHYKDLAKIFQDHPFMEQEFWLTAFYLNPNPQNYEAVSRCGMRNCRRRPNAEVNDENVKPERPERTDRPATNLINAKFGLLSSTIDVHEIVGTTNHEEPNADYEPLCKALRTFRLPENIIKDLLTVTFLPRNRSFAWAVNWLELRKRCKNLLKSVDQKRHFVELNMAEANDRLKFLKINYDKYKHRPQLDYGTIEEGYENVMNYTDYGPNSGDDDDDDDDIDFGQYKEETTKETEDKIDEEKKDNETEEVKSEEPSDLSDFYFIGTRRTRARTAAVLATALLKEDRSKRAEKKPDDTVDQAPEVKTTETPTPAAAPVPTPTPTIITTENINPVESPTIAVGSLKRKLNELLQERSAFNNSTNGFKSFPDIWDFEPQQLQMVEPNSVKFFESENLLKKFAKLEQFTKSSESESEAAPPEKKPKLDCTNVSSPLMSGESSGSATTKYFDQVKRIAAEHVDVEGTMDDEEAAGIINSLNEMTEDTQHSQNTDVFTAFENDLLENGVQVKIEVEATEGTESSMNNSLNQELPTSAAVSETFALPRITTVDDTNHHYDDDDDDSDSLKSDTSTTALRDSQEVNYYQKDYEMDDDGTEEPNAKQQVAQDENEKLHTNECKEDVEKQDSDEKLQENVDKVEAKKKEDEKEIEEEKEIEKEMEKEKEKEKEIVAPTTEEVTKEILAPTTEVNAEIVGLVNSNENAAIRNFKLKQAATLEKNKTDCGNIQPKVESKSEGAPQLEDAAHLVAATPVEASDSKVETSMQSSDPKAETAETVDPDDNSQTSVKNSENEELLKLCSEKKLQVSLRRLTVSDVMQLRQPRVRVKRMNFDTYFDQYNRRKRVQRKTYHDSSDNSSDSIFYTNKPTVQQRTTATRGPKRFIGQRKFTPTSSDSSTESDEYKYKRRFGRPTRGRGGSSVRGGSTSQRGGHFKNLIVTPRSASGLKLRISSSVQETVTPMEVTTPDCMPLIDYIEIPSSSSEHDNSRSPIVEIIEEEDLTADPLYEDYIPL